MLLTRESKNRRLDEPGLRLSTLESEYLNAIAIKKEVKCGGEAGKYNKASYLLLR